MAIETEIKFRVHDLDELTARLKAAGFVLETPRSFESNVLYDTPERKLRSQTEILRIRNYAGRWTVTHKRPLDPVPGTVTEPTAERHKHRIETETEVADGAAMAVLFQSLGLLPAFRYEKWRTEWRDSKGGGEGHCVIDETPIGNYAELEGTSEWIDRMAAQLGVDASEFSTLSYGRLFEMWRTEHHSTVSDLTFAAVEAHQQRT